MDEKEKDRLRREEITHSGIAGASAEVIQRYGSAVKEHIVAYSGIDNENGTHLTKGLKSISKSNVNPEFKVQNLKQQSGFSAEVKSTAKTNAENIINGIPERKSRTDDLGRVNDPLYDHVKLDADRNTIDGSGTQMKFVGNNPKQALGKMASKKFEKYVDNDVPIEVPSDYYDGMISEANDKIASLQKQLDKQLENGNTEIASGIKKQIEKYEEINKNLSKSNVSTKEARFAREHPELSTARDITKVSHRAGIQAAKSGAVAGGSISVIRNMVSVIKGEEEPEDAVRNIAKDTVTSAVTGYEIGFSGTAIKGFMQNAKSTTLQNLSKTNLPAMITTLAIDSARVMKKYFDGEIDGVECFELLGEQGFGTVVSSVTCPAGAELGLLLGTMIMPGVGTAIGTIIGGMLGSMFGYALASSGYQALLHSAKDAKIAREERLRIEKACEEHIALIKEYRNEMEEMIHKYFDIHYEIFNSSFSSIKSSLAIGDVDGFIASSNAISNALGRETQFDTMDEFEAMMNSGLTFKL